VRPLRQRLGRKPPLVRPMNPKAKEFLDAELAKFETWEGSDRFIRPLFSEEGGFQKAKQQGVGRDTILKFLGRPKSRVVSIGRAGVCRTWRKRGDKNFDFF